MAKWTEEQKIKALTIAEAVSITEAARQTGIPEGTIKSWLHRMKRNIKRNRATATRLQPEKIEQVVEAAIEEAKDIVRDIVVDRISRLADKLYSLAEKATEKVNVAISDPGEAPPGKRPEKHDRDGAAWVRALVGVMSQAIEKAQLLSGMPTSHQAQSGQVNIVHEQRYHIINELVADPDLAERIRTAYRRRVMGGVSEE